MPPGQSSWEAARRAVRDSRPRAPEWPEDVRQIPVEGIGLLGIDTNHNLYWDGKRLEIRRSLDLSTFQRIVTGAVAIATVLAALGSVTQGAVAVFDYQCRAMPSSSWCSMLIRTKPRSVDGVWVWGLPLPSPIPVIDPMVISFATTADNRSLERSLQNNHK